MHYYNVLLNDFISKNYKIEHDFLLFILDFFILILSLGNLIRFFDSIFHLTFEIESNCRFQF